MARNNAADDYWPDALAEADLGPLFAPQVRTMARRTDPDTSRDAAMAVSGIITTLQRRILDQFRATGPMSAKTCENLDEFKDAHGEPEFSPSTIRRRITDLHRMGWLTDTGRTEGGCTVYALSSTPLPEGQSA